jgi:error-prone DNA polymerase
LLTARALGGLGGARSPPCTTIFIELHAQSAFSFLEGAEVPETLVAEAAKRDMGAIALLDRDGVYGAPRLHRAAVEAGIKALVGAEITMVGGARLPLLVEDREGYQNLCRLITKMKLRAPKGEAAASWDDLETHATGLVCLTGGARGPLAPAIAAGDRDAARASLERLVAIFGKSGCFVEIQRHLDRRQEHHLQRLVALARANDVPLLAANHPLHARPGGRALADVLTCIREQTDLDHAGTLLAANGERALKGEAEMTRLFRDLPGAVANSGELALRLGFTLKDLGYRFPEFPVPPGTTSQGYLRDLVADGVRRQYGERGELARRARRQVEHELEIIGRLDLAGYFLIVWDIVEFCRAHDILVQGRGSAANSAVCYALGITAVDPVKMDLLFERFLSEARGEWPDIDLDLPSHERRETVIQHIYRQYGRLGAGMTANVITYRGRSAAREVGKALGLPGEMQDRLARLVANWGYQDPEELLTKHLPEAGCDPTHPRIRKFAALWTRIQDLPRHLGQHSGGMVVAADRLDDVVPLEPATMPGRVVIQWDKEDCAALGIVKVDLLGLRMMAVIQESIAMVHERGGDFDLAHLPEDREVYRTLQEADTIGVFQVESRAQMATLPRIHPETFYDLVVQVAIIRPGPIVGDMVHPYIRRRRGREPVSYPHPSLEPILKRTLGVPLFQEQLLRMAMVTAGFTGTEAEELRRAFGFKRSEARMREVETKLRAGMARQGIEGDAAEQIVHAITAFALYGFPECVVGGTKVIDADTGRRARIEDVAMGNVPLRYTLACDDDLKIRRRRVLKVTASGARAVYRLRTSLGRELEATAEHPVLTPHGWRALVTMHPGDHIASPRAFPKFGQSRWPRYRIIVLADLLAEGNLCHPSTMYFYTADPRHRDDYVRAVEEFGNTRATIARHHNCFSIHVRRRDLAQPSAAITWAKRIGLWGCNARSKRVPDEVFSLNCGNVGLLLARLWEGDGSLSATGHASYDTASRQLADDVQHLLLRLGIVARIYERIRPYREGHVTSFVVTVTGSDNLRRFQRRIARHFLSPRKRRLVNALASMGTGLATRALVSPDLTQRGYRRWVVRRLARFFDSPELARLAESDLYWDRVVSIEAVGVRETYDMEVEGDHNFLANDLVVHNSHASSFALLAYASAYLKVHHPAEFYAALLNNQPMGFYHAATIVKDAQRHGLRVLPVDITRSEWLTQPCGAREVRLGLRCVKGLRERAGHALLAARAARPFCSPLDAARRGGLDREELATLASIGAFTALGATRRATLWTVARADPGPLFDATPPEPAPSPLAEMTPEERVVADYGGTGVTVGPHPMALRRRELVTLGVTRASDLKAAADTSRVRVAGSVIVRQRPGTAKGFVFLSLEDETGIANVIVTPTLFARHRWVLVAEPFLLIEGILQIQDGVVSVRAQHVSALARSPHVVPSHDFG